MTALDPRDVTTVLDVGATIGIGALYFLTRSQKVHVELCDAGIASFAMEPTGRFGGRPFEMAPP